MQYLLRVADDHLILAQRLSEVTGHAPILEEELSVANVALDLLGQARTIYARIAELEGQGRTEDDLALVRFEHQYVNLLLVEQPNDDFAFVVGRQLLFSAFAYPFWDRATRSSDPVFAGAAAQAVKEAAYHVRYAREWVIRLGDGTATSHEKMQNALAELWPYTEELFERDAVVEAAVAEELGPDPADLRAPWTEVVTQTLRQATLTTPESPANWHQTGGRAGRHSEHLGHLLSELQYMQRAYPGMNW